MASLDFVFFFQVLLLGVLEDTHFVSDGLYIIHTFISSLLANGRYGELDCIADEPMITSHFAFQLGLFNSVRKTTGERCVALAPDVGAVCLDVEYTVCTLAYDLKATTALSMAGIFSFYYC